MAGAHEHTRTACQRSVGRGRASRGASAAVLGSCHRGDVLRIGIGGGGALGRRATITVESGEARWSDQVPGAEMKPNTD